MSLKKHVPRLPSVHNFKNPTHRGCEVHLRFEEIPIRHHPHMSKMGRGMKRREVDWFTKIGITHFLAPVYRDETGKPLTAPHAKK